MTERAAPRANPEPSASDGQEPGQRAQEAFHNARYGFTGATSGVDWETASPANKHAWAAVEAELSVPASPARAEPSASDGREVSSATPRKCRQCGDTFTWVSYDETRCLGCHSGDDWQGEVQDCLHRAVDDPHEPSVDALVDAVVVLTHQIGRLEREHLPASPARAEPAGGWVACEERLPPDDTTCLGWKLGWVRAGTVFHTSDGAFFDTEKSTIPQVGVTHWAPLLPAPQSQHPSEVKS